MFKVKSTEYIKIAVIEKNPNDLESSKYLVKEAEGDCEGVGNDKFALVRPVAVKEVLAGTSLYFTNMDTGVIPVLSDSEIAELSDLLDSLPKNVDYIVFKW